MTTGEPGTNASVTNSGTSSAAVFDFVIPRGQDGSGGGGAAGVSSFNGRTGAVTSQVGDYTAAQVGAADATTTQQALQALSDEIDGILAGTSPITIPPATEVKVGGIKVGEGLSATTDGTTSVAISQEADNATGILNGAIYTSIPRPSAVYPLVEVTTAPATASIQVTATKGELSVQGTTDGNGKVDIELSAFGVWTFTATIDGESVSRNIAIYTSQFYTLTLSAVNVFGVSWDTTNPSPQLTRLTPENDPNGIVTVAITEEPVAAVGTGSGSSPFDNYLPWSGMEQYNIIDGAVSYKQGEPGFSQIDYDTMVYIPPFYYRREQSGNNQLFYVGDGAFGGAKIHPGSGKYISRYPVSQSNKSVSGGAITNQTTYDSVRSYASGKTGTWWLFDGPAISAIQILYLIEFADLYSQNLIGFGCGSSPISTTGATDIMIYHTGRVSGDVSQNSQVQYRWIEQPYANFVQCIDGMAKDENGVLYICNTPSNYSSSITENYESTGIEQPGGVDFSTGLSLVDGYEWLMFPTTVGGSSSTFTTDVSYNGGSGVRAVGMGGNYTNGARDGMFAWYGHEGFSVNQYYCFKLCFKEAEQ